MIALPVVRLVHWRPWRDAVASWTAAATFSSALGIASVALPLVALRSGYSAAEVGVLTAVSAIAQIATRAMLGAVMRRMGDWLLIVAAACALAASNAIVAISMAVVPFVAAELLQGMARACFWTGSQTHAVRGSGPSIGALARINFVSGAGLFAGPVVAGVLLEASVQTALVVGAVAAAVAIVPASMLDRLPPFAPPPQSAAGRIWRRPGVDVGCWAAVNAGSWRALLSSFVPVALEAAGQPAATTGMLISVANGTSLLGSVLVARLSGKWIRRSYVVGTVATGAATGLVAIAAGSWWAAGALLAMSGLGAGALQTVGPAIATESVHPQERGDAIAATGTFRAAALFITPLTVAGAVAVLPLAAAVAATGGLMAASVAAVRGRFPAPDPGDPR